ncbi:MAG: glycoside hydrolase family 10 protein [Synechococcales bacterium]|nr:glycoside hydrolase family 10 protein [Synechococcales bacterium]
MRNLRWVWRLVVAFAMGLAIALYPPPIPSIAQHSPQAELRGVWLTNIDSGVLFSEAEVQAGVERLARLNFNTLYPTVWNWGYPLYPSAIAQRTIGEALDPHPALQGRDPLAELIEQGHRHRLAVIPWFEFGLMAPSYSELARQHPDWLTSRRDGSRVFMQGRHPRVWLSPTHPEVRQFMVDLILEVVTRYDVDGIQLDDHFGMPVEFGYDPSAIALYQQTHNGQNPPADPQDAAWVRWRADQITQLMAEIHRAVKAVRPDCIISLSPNPPTFAYEQYLQDWATWQRQGLIDELVVQMYRASVEAFVNGLEQPELTALGSSPMGIGILTGLKNQPAPTQLIRDQVKAVRDRALAGISFFFYESLGDRDADFQALFPDPAPRPSSTR